MMAPSGAEGEGRRACARPEAWDELLTSDTAAAEAFYGKVFGHGVDKMPMPGME
jgi:predicted enzyme related to lactoylglutathione lyase